MYRVAKSILIQLVLGFLYVLMEITSTLASKFTAMRKWPELSNQRGMYWHDVTLQNKQRKKTWPKKIHLHIILHNISKRIFVIRLGRRWAFVRCQQRLNTKSTNQKFMQHVKAKRSQGRRIKRRTIIETTNVGYFSWIVHAQIKKNTLNADATV